MSKTRGNVLDPLDIIDLYGADALRFALTTGNSAGNNMRINESKLEASRNFANKLWNAARFSLANLEGANDLEGWHRPNPVHRHDRWIMSRLTRVAAEIHRSMEQYQFGEAQRLIHDFLWSEFCDWYIEMAKVRLRNQAGNGSSPLPVLAYVLEKVLRLLHPFMPFITEEIWQTLMDRLPTVPDRPAALIAASYPEYEPTLIDEEAEAEMGAVAELVRAVRNLRAELGIQPSHNLEAIVSATGILDVVKDESDTIKALARVELLTPGSDVEPTASPWQVTLVLSEGTVTIPLEGLVDLDRETARLARELEELGDNRSRLTDRLQDQEFLSKAPEEVVEREQQRLEAVEERRTKIAEVLSRLRS